MFVKFKLNIQSIFEIFWDEMFMIEIQQKLDDLDVWPLSIENEALLKCNFAS